MPKKKNKYNILPENDLTEEKFSIPYDTDINISDDLYSAIAETVKNSDMIPLIRSAVTAGASEIIPAAYSYSENYPTVKNDNGGDVYRDLRDIISEFNKPIQIILDGDVIGKTVLNYDSEIKRNSNT